MIDRKLLYLNWYDCYLESKNCGELTKQAPVKVFVMGVNQWKDELWASSSVQDTDWVARLIDVHPDGFVQRLTDTIVRASYQSPSPYP